MLCYPPGVIPALVCDGYFTLFHIDPENGFPVAPDGLDNGMDGKFVDDGIGEFLEIGVRAAVPGECLFIRNANECNSAVRIGECR